MPGLIPNEVYQGIAEYRGEAYRLTQVEERRRSDTLQGLNRARAALAQPNIDQAMVNRLFGSALTQTSADAGRASAMFRNAGAATGTYGGGAFNAGLGGIELQRVGQVMNQQTSIANLVAQDRAQTRLSLWNADRDIASVMNQTPAMEYADFLGQQLELLGGLQISKDQMDAAKQNRKSSEKGAKMGLIGSIIGGALSLI